MSVFDHVTPLIPQVPGSMQLPKKLGSSCISPPASLSSPIIKKTPIQIPSFDERGLVYSNDPNADRSFVPIQEKTCNQASSKQRNHEERASTLSRIKPKTHCSTKPDISTFSAPNMNYTVPFCDFKPVPNRDTEPGTLHPRESSPFLQQTQVDKSISLTLTLPTPQQLSSTTPFTQENKQPSPSTRERHARSIPISNAKKLSVEAKHGVLGRDTLLSFSHPNSKTTSRGCQKQVFNRDVESSNNPPTTCQNSSVLQGRLEGLKTGTISKNKPVFKNVTSPVSAETNIKTQQGNVPSGKAVSEEIQSNNVSKTPTVFEGRATYLSPSLHRKCLEYLQNASLRRTHNKQRSIERHKELPVSPKMLHSAESSFIQPVSPNMKAQRKQPGLHKTTFSSKTPSQKETPQTAIVTASYDCSSSQKSRHLSKSAQMDRGSTLHQSDTVSKDCSCQSSHIRGRVVACECAATKNLFKTCLVAPQTQKAFKPASFSTKDKEQSPPKNTSHREVLVVDTGQNKSDVFKPSTEYVLSGALSQYNTETCFVSEPALVACCPLDTSCLGSRLKYDLHSQPNNRCEETASSSISAKQQKNTEKEEDLYVTMYCPGSVYVGELAL